MGRLNSEFKLARSEYLKCFEIININFVVPRDDNYRIKYQKNKTQKDYYYGIMSSLYCTIKEQSTLLKLLKKNLIIKGN